MPNFSRIQFTPDMLPADVIGTMIYNQQKTILWFVKGPIFANFYTGRRDQQGSGQSSIRLA
jgi:MoxR-like ATPase